MLLSEYTWYLIDAETGKRFEVDSNIPPGSLVNHYHDRLAVGTVICVSDQDDDNWCNSADILWSIPPDSLRAARTALDETYSCYVPIHLNKFRHFEKSLDIFDSI